MDLDPLLVDGEFVVDDVVAPARPESVPYVNEIDVLPPPPGVKSPLIVAERIETLLAAWVVAVGALGVIWKLCVTGSAAA